MNMMEVDGYKAKIEYDPELDSEPSKGIQEFVAGLSRGLQRKWGHPKERVFWKIQSQDSAQAT
jgi:predicted HicB family RNase H-like nuclease